MKSWTGYQKKSTCNIDFAWFCNSQVTSTDVVKKRRIPVPVTSLDQRPCDVFTSSARIPVGILSSLTGELPGGQDAKKNMAGLGIPVPWPDLASFFFSSHFLRSWEFSRCLNKNRVRSCRNPDFSNPKQTSPWDFPIYFLDQFYWKTCPTFLFKRALLGARKTDLGFSISFWWSMDDCMGPVFFTQATCLWIAWLCSLGSKPHQFHCLSGKRKPFIMTIIYIQTVHNKTTAFNCSLFSAFFKTYFRWIMKTSRNDGKK